MEQLSFASEDFYETILIAINNSPMYVCRGLFHNVFTKHSCESMKGPYDMIMGIDDYMVPQDMAKNIISSMMIYSLCRDTKVFDFISSKLDQFAFYKLLEMYRNDTEVFKEIYEHIRSKIMNALLYDYTIFEILAYGAICNLDDFNERQHSTKFYRKCLSILLHKLEVQDIYSVNGIDPLDNRIKLDVFDASMKLHFLMLRRLANSKKLFMAPLPEEFYQLICGLTNDNNYLDALREGFKPIKFIDIELFIDLVFRQHKYAQKITRTNKYIRSSAEQLEKFSGITVIGIDDTINISGPNPYYINY